MFGFRKSIVALAIVLSFLAPKTSAWVLSLHPNIFTAQMCTGSELVTIYIGSDGIPIPIKTQKYQPCILDTLSPSLDSVYAFWLSAPRSYRHSFQSIADHFARFAHLKLLREVRGPPVLVS